MLWPLSPHPLLCLFMWEMLYYHPSLAPKGAQRWHCQSFKCLNKPHLLRHLFSLSAFYLSPFNAILSNKLNISSLCVSYHPFKSNQQLYKALPLQQNVTGHSHFCSWVFSDCDLSLVFVLDVLCLGIQAAGVPAGLKGSFCFVFTLLSVVGRLDQ